MYDLTKIGTSGSGSPAAKAVRGKMRGAVEGAVCASALSMIIDGRGAARRYGHRERYANECE